MPGASSFLLRDVHHLDEVSFQTVQSLPAFKYELHAVLPAFPVHSGIEVCLKKCI